MPVPIVALVLVHDLAHRRYVCMARGYFVRLTLSLKSSVMVWDGPLPSLVVEYRSAILLMKRRTNS